MFSTHITMMAFGCFTPTKKWNECDTHCLKAERGLTMYLGISPIEYSQEIPHWLSSDTNTSL